MAQQDQEDKSAPMGGRQPVKLAAASNDPRGQRIDGISGGCAMSPSTNRTTPTIARIWRGRTTRARADEYAAYLYEHGIRPLEQKALAVVQLREDRAGESEFVTISFWENVEAMSRFAGKDPRKIHHLARDPEFLIELPDNVQVLEIAAQKGLFGVGADAPPGGPTRQGTQ
jgi:hypothetical protein